MTPSELRTRILILLEENSRLPNSSGFLHDTQLAEATDQPVPEIQRQLDILAAEGLTTPANTFGVRCASISPRGSLAIEDVLETPAQPKKPAIGFMSR